VKRIRAVRRHLVQLLSILLAMLLGFWIVVRDVIVALVAMMVHRVLLCFTPERKPAGTAPQPGG
jgi:hypothetical protein